jgi:hypothetical protein
LLECGEFKNENGTTPGATINLPDPFVLAPASACFQHRLHFPVYSPSHFLLPVFEW